MPLYIVHYKPGTKMFNPSDEAGRGHLNYTPDVKLTTKLLNKDKSVAKWYFITGGKPC